MLVVTYECGCELYDPGDKYPLFCPNGHGAKIYKADYDVCESCFNLKERVNRYEKRFNLLKQTIEALKQENQMLKLTIQKLQPENITYGYK